MAVVGFNYNKVMAERKKPVKGKVKVNSHAEFIKVDKTNLAFSKDQVGLDVDFRFTIEYEPKVATIEIEGTALYMDKNTKVDKLVKDWKKTKILPREVSAEMMNYILAKCNVEAIILSRDVNIPSPVPLPKLSAEAPE